jgi:hypothetical protein
MRIVSEIETWEGHPPEALQGMLDSIARLREHGLDAIETEGRSDREPGGDGGTWLALDAATTR